MVQTQMVLRPVTPDRPVAEGGNPSATDVGNAIRWLDIGASGQADAGETGQSATCRPSHPAGRDEPMLRGPVSLYGEPACGPTTRTMARAESGPRPEGQVRALTASTKPSVIEAACERDCSHLRHAGYCLCRRRHRRSCQVRNSIRQVLGKSPWPAERRRGVGLPRLPRGSIRRLRAGREYGCSRAG